MNPMTISPSPPPLLRWVVVVVMTASALMMVMTIGSSTKGSRNRRCQLQRRPAALRGQGTQNASWAAAGRRPHLSFSTLSIQGV